MTYRRTIERRTAASTKESIKTKTKQNKTNVTPEKDVMASANQTPGGYTGSRHLWLVNRGERTSTSPLALGYPFLGPSRHVRAYQPLHAVRSPALAFSAGNDPFRHEMFRPLFSRSAPFPLVLACSRPSLVGVDAESSGVVVQEIHPVHSFSWPPIKPASPTRYNM